MKNFYQDNIICPICSQPILLLGQLSYYAACGMGCVTVFISKEKEIIGYNIISYIDYDQYNIFSHGKYGTTIYLNNQLLIFHIDKMINIPVNNNNLQVIPILNKCLKLKAFQ